MKKNSQKSITKFLLIPLALAILISCTTVSAGGANQGGKIDLYIAPQIEYLPVGNLLTHLLESRLGLEVNKKIQYLEIGLRKTANGNSDLFIGVKLPHVHEVPWTYSKYQLCDLGPIYEDVVVGWGVPTYIPTNKLNSALDLGNKDIKSRLQGEIIVYDFDKKILEESKKLIRTVKGLQDYKLVELKEMVANSELNRATRNKEWIVMTLRRPSIPYSLHDIRFIEILTREQSVHLFGRKDLMAKYSSEVTQFLSRFYLPIELVEELVRLHDQDKSNAVKKFINRHPAMVEYWLGGVESL